MSAVLRIPVEEAAMSKIDGDPLRETDDRLWAWARWRRWANRLPTGGHRCTLGTMVDEADEVARGSWRVTRGVVDIRVVRRALQASALRERAAARVGDDEDLKQWHLERAKAIEASFRKEPTATETLPWASMIHGSGTKPDPECPEEEEVDWAVSHLPAQEREMFLAHWGSDLPADIKCTWYNLSEATYWRRIRDTRWKIKRALGI